MFLIATLALTRKGCFCIPTYENILLALLLYNVETNNFLNGSMPRKNFAFGQNTGIYI